jgi:hypothetical protein
VVKRLLLDTHVLLWWLSQDTALGPEAHEAIRDAQNDVYVSPATTWETSIKKALGKLEAPDDLDCIVEEERFLRHGRSKYTKVRLRGVGRAQTQAGAIHAMDYSLAYRIPHAYNGEAMTGVDGDPLHVGAQHAMCPVPA